MGKFLLKFLYYNFLTKIHIVHVILIFTFFGWFGLEIVWFIKTVSQIKTNSFLGFHFQILLFHGPVVLFMLFWILWKKQSLINE